MLSILSKFIENHLLPNYADYYSEFGLGEYKSWSLRKKAWFWICNFPGIHIHMGRYNICMLEWFEGHPWNRIYINTPKHHLGLGFGNGKFGFYDKNTNSYYSKCIDFRRIDNDS